METGQDTPPQGKDEEKSKLTIWKILSIVVVLIAFSFFLGRKSAPKERKPIVPNPSTAPSRYPAVKASTEPFLTYENTILGYTLSYPQGWQLIEEESAVKFIPDENIPSCLLGDVVGTTCAFIEISENLSGTITEDGSGLEKPVTEFADVSAGNNTWLTSGPSQFEGIFILYYFIAYREGYLQLKYMDGATGKADYENPKARYQKEINQILSSFKVLKFEL